MRLTSVCTPPAHTPPHNMPECQAPFRFLALLLAFLHAAHLATGLTAQQNPTFEQRSPKKLRCRVTAIQTNKAKVTVLEVAVTNNTNCTAEPLQFAMESKGRRNKKNKRTGPPIQRFARARMPLVGRFGDGIAPGKTKRYMVQAYLPKKKKPKVTVTAACFYRKAPKRSSEPTPVAKDLRETRGTNQFLGQTFDTASFALHNPLPRTADVWVRATYTRPVRDSLLMAYRVPAGQTRQIEVGVLPHTQGFDDSDRAFATNVKITEVEVVDWIQIGEVDDASAKEAFLTSYAGWHRWPDRVRQARANFTTQEVGANRHNKSDVNVKISGTLVVDASRKTTVQLDKRSQKRMAKLIKDDTGFFWPSSGFLQSQAIRFLCRHSEERLKDKNQLKWLAGHTVQLLGPAFFSTSQNSWTTGSDGYSANAPRFALDDDGRIASDGWGMNEGNDWTWTTEPLGQGWVLAKRHSAPRNSTRAETESWQHTRTGGFATVTEYTRLVTNKEELETRQTIKFSNWQFTLAPEAAAANQGEGPGPGSGPGSGSGPATAAVPNGEGADKLAKSWSQLYQFPAVRAKWAADLAVATSGTDLSWQGHTRFQAVMKRKGIGTRQPELTLDLNGAASSAVESDLASVYLDRLGMWFGSDPQSMGPFEQAFAGATIHARNRKGWHRLDNHAVAEVRTQGDRVTEFRMRNGTHRRFHYELCDGAQVITRIERDVARKTEVLIRPVRWNGWIVPTRYEFRRIFGDDWGPEIFTLSKLRLLD